MRQLISFPLFYAFKHILENLYNFLFRIWGGDLNSMPLINIQKIHKPTNWFKPCSLNVNA